MDIQTDLKEFIELLNYHDVEYVLWKSKVRGPLSNIEVWFIGKDQLIATKRASGRYKDLGDLESLGEL